MLQTIYCVFKEQTGRQLNLSSRGGNGLSYFQKKYPDFHAHQFRIHLQDSKKKRKENKPCVQRDINGVLRV